MTFAKGRSNTFAKKLPSRQNHILEYEYDIWCDQPDNFENFKFGIAAAVVNRCIMNFTQPGQVVYDPFSGSGTTAVAAIASGREYLGSEINKEYFDLSQRRLSTIMDKKEFFNGDK